MIVGMYVIELTFEVGEQRRLDARPAHREKLARLHEQGIVVMSGPWEDDSGALLIFDTDEAGIERIMADDPYFRAPGVTVTSVRRWNPIFR
jgi:uncharacterized protein YciI